MKRIKFLVLFIMLILLFDVDNALAKHINKVHFYGSGGRPTMKISCEDLFYVGGIDNDGSAIVSSNECFVLSDYELVGWYVDVNDGEYWYCDGDDKNSKNVVAKNKCSNYHLYPTQFAIDAPIGNEGDIIGLHAVWKKKSDSSLLEPNVRGSKYNHYTIAYSDYEFENASYKHFGRQEVIIGQTEQTLRYEPEKGDMVGWLSGVDTGAEIIFNGFTSDDKFLNDHEYIKSNYVLNLTPVIKYRGTLYGPFIDRNEHIIQNYKIVYKGYCEKDGDDGKGVDGIMTEQSGMYNDNQLIKSRDNNFSRPGYYFQGWKVSLKTKQKIYHYCWYENDFDHKICDDISWHEPLYYCTGFDKPTYYYDCQKDGEFVIVRNLSDLNITSGEDGDIYYLEAIWKKITGLEYITCGDIHGIPKIVPQISSFLVTLLKTAAPLVLILVSIISLVKSITSAKEEEIKKAQTSLIKKLIIAGLVFFVVSIVQFVVLKLQDANEKQSLSSCLACFLNGPDSCKGVYYKIGNETVWADGSMAFFD